jgi:branched-chain amino acid aminotransferase
MLSVAQQKFQIEKVSKSKLESVDLKDLKFGRNFSDHMFVSEYRNGSWDNGKIIPYGNISISPAMCSLHYGQSIFEGMKAYKGIDGKVRLFRPYENASRMNISAERMCMPTIAEDFFVAALKELVRLDSEWVPNLEGHSLYLRPFMFADETFLGVKASEQYKFMIICSPASSYYSEPVRVKVEKHYTRAMQGGVGYAKAAGNYAAAMYPSKLAAEEGYHQLIWTDAVEHKYIEEAGTMNLMFIVDGKLLTPSVDGHTILEGITRDSVIQVARKLGYALEERKISVEEIVQAHDNGKLQDAFGLGTAANVAFVKSIGYEGRELELPALSERKISTQIAQYLSDLKYGKIEDAFGWIEIL